MTPKPHTQYPKPQLGTCTETEELYSPLRDKKAGVAKWQTHYFEVVAPKGVGVQVPPPARENS